MAEKITFHTEKRKVGDLVPYEHNPRTLSKKQAADLRKSLQKFSLAEIPVVNTDNTILAGHQRLRILSEIESADFEIDVRVPNRQLSEKEAQEYLIRSNKNTGEWDFDELANSFEMGDLVEWGFSEKELLGDDLCSDDERYTKKIATPLYEVKNEKPDIGQLVSESRKQELLIKINNSSVSQDEKEFLIKAAYRFDAFDYASIAEYYACATPEMQALMEELALVIIDINSAIANGFVSLSEEINDLIESEDK